MSTWQAAALTVWGIGTLTALAFFIGRGKLVNDYKQYVADRARDEYVDREFADVEDKIAGLTLQQNNIKQRIREIVPGPGKWDVGEGARLVISASVRFNEKKALQLIPDEIAPLVTYAATRVDKDKLKVLLPEVFSESQDKFDDRVSLR